MTASDDRIVDKCLHITGSASETCDTHNLSLARAFVEALVHTWIAKGGRVLVFLGREPRIREDDPATSLTFDWLVLEVLGRIRDSAPAGECCRALLSSESPKRRFPSDRLNLLQSLLSCGSLSLEFIDEDRHIGGFIRERLAETADAVVAIGGGKGVVDLHAKCRRLHTPVLPFDLAIGASCNDGEGAVKLHRLAASDPASFFPGIPENLTNALVSLSMSVGKLTEDIARESVELISEELATVQSAAKSPKEPPGTVRLLLVTSNPSDSDPLNLDAEGMGILQFLLDGAASDRLSVKILRCATPQLLRSKLASFKPHILHFSGHGYDQGIVLQGGTGVGVCVDIDALAQLLSVFKEDLRLLVLNSCSSAEPARRLSQSVDFVVGMKDDVDDDTAIAFAEGFFDGIANGWSVQQAFDLGVASCKLSRAPSPDLPILYVRAGADARTAIVP